MTIKRFLLLQRQYQTMLINFCATWAYIQGFSGFNAQLSKPKMHKTAPEFNENPSEIQNFPNEFCLVTFLLYSLQYIKRVK